MSEFHVAFVILSFLAVLYSDEQGLRWMLGKKERLAHGRVKVLHYLVSAGLAGVILTGGLMFLDRAEYLLSQPVFIVKMIFVLALVVNGLLIGSLSRIASEKSFAELTRSERARVLLSGGVSVAGWIGALICGLILGA